MHQSMMAMMPTGPSTTSAISAPPRPTRPPPTMKIAVIGGGISGLSAAYLLSRHPENEVTIFESEKALGMGVHTLQFGDKHIDCPPRSFCAAHYVHLASMYTEAGVEMEPYPGDMSFSDFGDPAFYCHASNWRIGALRLPSPWHVAAMLRKFSVRAIWDHMHFFLSSSDGIPHDMTLGEYVTKHKYTREYLHGILLPMMSMVLTCSNDACLNYPVGILKAYVSKSNAVNQVVTTNGSTKAAAQLARHCKTIHVETTVTGVWQASADGRPARIAYTKKDGQALEDEFDHIVISSQACSALTFLQDADAEMQALLAQVPHETATVVIHRDPILMPRDRRDWSFYNFITAKPGMKLKPGIVENMVTLWVARFHEAESTVKTLFQTWNPLVDPNPDLVLLRAKFLRPLFTKSSHDLVQKIRERQGRGNLWFSSTYCVFAVPLQESGAESAVEVATMMGFPVEWPKMEVAAGSDSIGLVSSSSSLFSWTNSLLVGVPLVVSAAIILLPRLR
ncbi:Aste57867_22521 [Aphanomyces stellatus]|uniref:Aste57867_22521 protein n=1 Tax=Aphanomyces stellatus TaxID=120398 RepID=A0A485LLM2_9STRA|nr:hypothetical protein As57867_022451 [Aphanomyces stellatus]VFT99181.1 Aste57867_22521 [Aphanomyces stellatus]